MESTLRLRLYSKKVGELRTSIQELPAGYAEGPCLDCCLLAAWGQRGLRPAVTWRGDWPPEIRDVFSRNRPVV